MRKLLLTILTLLFPIFLLAQENPNYQLTFRQGTVDLDSANAKSVKILFPSEPSPGSISATQRRGNIWPSGYYTFWCRPDTSSGHTIGNTDSLNVTIYELMYDGSRADQCSTAVLTNFDWTVDTWHGPFHFALNAGFGLEAVIQKTCTGSADTLDLRYMIIY